MTTSAPVLFLPGTLCDERVWLPVWQRMKISQRRYVPLQWAATKDDMLALTSDRVIQDEKVHLVGYSMGGYIAALWASQNMEHVASITLIGYDAKGLSSEEIARRKQMVSMLSNGEFKPENPAYFARFVHTTHQENPDVMGVVQSMAEDLGKNTLVGHTQATTPREDLIKVFAKSKVPVNIIAADDDEIAPLGSLQAMADKIPTSNIYKVENSGHMMLLEQPEKLATLLSNCIDV
ncbi:alpha/beta hydrolase [Alteromonas sp. CI.11.F.A3]|uniref:alpha/beta fold hydrolase n=1 Tax=unclassified Alteromonas TaxID=2614992 RepID=UPI001B3A6D78|nr:alpha/beta hydrolase [Alteromonas sp. CI.11.F.A3]MBQ4827866.1 alpha/beta hydrolase [Alteromonas sp. MMG017]WOI37299.1 alpha/beta hydrolase [Alteromonas sp. CI.11.F.A3]